MYPARIVDIDRNSTVMADSNERYNEIQERQDTVQSYNNGGYSDDQFSVYRDKDVSETSSHEKKPQPFSHHVWDPLLKPVLISYLIPVGMATFIMMIVVWLLFSIYWGSMYKGDEKTPNIKGVIVNRDNGVIGNSIVQAFLDVNNCLPVGGSCSPHSTWILHDPSDYPTHEKLLEAIEPKEEYYIAIEIVEGATDKFLQARDTGDASFCGEKSVNIIFASARNPTNVPKYVFQPAQSLFERTQAQLTQNLTSHFISSNSNNPEAIQTANRAPCTLTNPISANFMDIRPWTTDVAMAPTFVGMIYLVILSFQVVMAEYGARFAIQHYLHFGAFAFLRLATPCISSLFISLMISLINIPFDLPFDGSFSYGAGFMVYWMCTQCGIVVFFLCLESVLTLVTPKFIGIFLIFFIIANVSVSNTELSISPSFYKYGYAMPFYNLRHIYLHIFFGVGERNMILKYIGIIWAWMLVVASSFMFVVWFDYKKRYKSHIKTIKNESSP